MCVISHCWHIVLVNSYSVIISVGAVSVLTVVSSAHADLAGEQNTVKTRKPYEAIDSLFTGIQPTVYERSAANRCSPERSGLVD